MQYTLFDTSLGTLGIAWTPSGVRKVQLPETDREATAAVLSRDATLGDPPPFVREAIDRIQRHMAGQPQEFLDIPLDLAGLPPFHRAVYQSAMQVPAGQTCSYKDLAVAMGKAGAARAVGQALARNPLPVVVPCHRVLAHHGKPGGFSAFGGLETKRRMLLLEGITLPNGRSLVPEAAPDSLWEPGVREAAVEWLSRKDRKLARAIESVGPCKLAPEWPGQPFAALAESILYQQLAGAAAATIVRRFQALFPGRDFPEPRDVVDAEDAVLRSAGISGGKISALRTLARACIDGTLPLATLDRLPSDEVRRELVKLRGIGNWTVDMFLIFHLGRPDVFPPGDLGIRKAIERLYRLPELPSPTEMEAISRKWIPYRTVATWYLWRSLGVTTIGQAPKTPAGCPA